jgi:hypothetical protein
MSRLHPAAWLRGILAAALGVALFAATAPAAVAREDSPVVFVSDTSYVPAGQVHEGDLVSVMGDVKVDGHVTGQVVSVLGTVEINGEVDQDVVSVLSKTHLGPKAKLDGEFVTVGWTPLRDEGSSIEGQRVNINFMNLLPFAGQGGGLKGLLRFVLILKLVKMAFLFVVLILIASLMPRRLSVMASVFPNRWGFAFLVGLLTYTGVLIGTVILTCTIIGIPLAIILWFVAKAIKWMGLAAILYLMGQTMGRNIWGRQLPHLASVLCGYIVFAIASMVPILGWGFSLVMSMTAVGLAIVSRFGSEATVAQALGTPPPMAPGWQPAPAQAPAGGAAGSGPGSTPSFS